MVVIYDFVDTDVSLCIGVSVVSYISVCISVIDVIALLIDMYVIVVDDGVVVVADYVDVVVVSDCCCC